MSKLVITVEFENDDDLGWIRNDLTNAVDDVIQGYIDAQGSHGSISSDWDVTE